jgi:hypothetical protein
MTPCTVSAKVVRKGISEGEVALKRQLEERTRGAETTIAELTEKEMTLRIELANLEGQMRFECDLDHDHDYHDDGHDVYETRLCWMVRMTIRQVVA